MNETEMTQNDVVELDLSQILRALVDRAWVVIFTAVLFSIITFAGTYFFITPQYEASAVFYVNNSALSIGNTSLSIESGDISASKSLVNTYIVILKDRVTLIDIIDYAGIDMSYVELRENLLAEPLEETEVFKVVVTNPDPEVAEILANSVAYILPKRISNIIEGSSVKIVSGAIIPAKASSPNYSTNTVVGFLLGIVLSVGAIALRVVLDSTIRNDEDIAKCCKHPILVSVPDMATSGKGSSSHYYGYGKSTSAPKESKYAPANQSQKRAVMGPDISFAASEAYKLLRTKLQFSFTDENDCHVIGLSSALSGEGKSLTAVNLTHTLAQLNKKVILVDCDMRRPTLAEKLGIKKYPGLSSYLTRQCKLEEIVQTCSINNSAYEFHVISAGQNPPNPIELLSSERMKRALEIMRKTYDYVILDLPPVGEVSDAMSVSKETDGMLLVVRQNYCNRGVLSDAVHQFEFIHAKILGVVFNCTSEHGGKYGSYYHRRYYKSYYRRYYSRSAENKYADSARRASREFQNTPPQTK